MLAQLLELKKTLKGDLYTDEMHRRLYATDASDFREMPLAVARPKSNADIKKLVDFARKFKTSLIPRTAGTSLGGQVVGKGIIVDVSKYMTSILEVNKEEKWVRLQAGVILDELNMYLKPYGLFFGPETSTANRCMIGGMVGNNSCGAHSILYGTTRDHVLELDTILADGSEVVFKSVTQQEFDAKKNAQTLEGNIYRFVDQNLSKPEVQQEIRDQFPKPEIRRRNTGYAIDELLETDRYTNGKPAFNFCKLLAGSEGTLAFTTEIKLNLVDLPPSNVGVVAIHLNTVEDACLATVEALKFHPGAIELLDDKILECTKANIEQSKNRFFITGDPGAIIVVEFARATKEEVERIAAELEAHLRTLNLGYHFPVLYGGDVKKIWALRKAGLGLLANVPGDFDTKAVACIEDTAVSVHDQLEYTREFKAILAKYDKDAVFYAHIGDGEMHLRPLLNLKDPADRELYFKITDDVASLIKKFRGSLSGEHGDGRVRGMFLPKMVGEKNYQLLCDLKKTWDPDSIFNPNKIVNTPKMNESLRYVSGQKTRQFNTVFDFSATGGILRLAEKCNGSGDCRKPHTSGGAMCPSYMATRNEKDSTRARANILREFLTNSDKANAFDHKEVYEVMDLCLSCKACKSECPSNVDVARLKAEFLQQYYDANGVPFRSRVIANYSIANAINSNWPGLANFVQKNTFTSYILKGILGFAQERPLPLLSETTMRKWAKKNLKRYQPQNPKSKVYLFCDEFTNYNELELGITAVKLLTGLGYAVEIPDHEESGRTYLSKGLVRDAKKIANKNIDKLGAKVSAETPLLGIEPSAILSFRDEYLALAEDKKAAKNIADNSFMIDEFLVAEFEAGRISSNQFTDKGKKVKLQGHCHQKSLSSATFSEKMLSIPVNYNVESIPSGCCGMAGSFGYEKEHYDISMKIGELVLFPFIRKTEEETIFAAPGTSCRHQIKDGTGKTAQHTIEILYDALI